MAIKLSVLDLAPIAAGSTAADAFRNMLDLARHVERLGYHRFWLAEHHNMPGVGSSATSVLIGHVAAGTTTIRVGSGGVMLPNHAPLIIAEQFGTLAALYPGRIDLGLGRAPGTDQLTLRALRRDPLESAEAFPDDVQELRHYFRPAAESQPVRAVPGAGLDVPIWILGSSTFGARLAAALGLPYAFASHFAPDQLENALRIYRETFRPSDQLDRPYTMAGVNVFAADDEVTARRLFTSVQQQFINLRRGRPGPVPPPVDDISAIVSRDELVGVDRALRYAVVGDPQQVARGLAAFQAHTGVDELMVTAQIFDHAARLRSFGIAAEAAAGAQRETVAVSA
jgi:luciferase family oxidoreductase group 1